MKKTTRNKIMALVISVLMAVASYFGLPKQVVKPVVDGAVEVTADLVFPEAVTPPTNLPLPVTGA